MRLFPAILLTLVLSPAVGHGDWTTNFLYRTSANGMPYRLFVPSAYRPATYYPLVLYLHYAGHEGTDNETHMYEAVTAKTNWMAERTHKHCPPLTKPVSEWRRIFRGRESDQSGVRETRIPRVVLPSALEGERPREPGE